MTVTLDARQARNFTAALVVPRTAAELARAAFGVWSESRGYNYANGGMNESHSPGFDTHPEWPAILRRSTSLPNDGVRNNGRSCGVLQQTPSEVGGAWGDMAGTMTPATAVARFLDRLRVTDDPIYRGLLLNPDGSKEFVEVRTPSPVVADVLRVQQPLAEEARSDNYGVRVLSEALEIAARFAPKPTFTATEWLRLIAAVAAGK